MEEIIKKDESMVTVVTNDQEETYNLYVVPDEKTPIVSFQKKRLSAELDLKRLIVNLNNTTTLIFIAYNALSGTTAQSKVSGLQKKLSDLCAKSQVAMNDIVSNTDTVLAELPFVFKLILTGQMKKGMTFLGTCSKYAGIMAETSENLAKEFDAMCDTTQSALEESQDIYAGDLQKRDEINQQIADSIAVQKALSEKSKKLNDDLEEIKEDYSKAEKREESAQKQAFIAGIVGICTNALTAGLSSYVGNMKKTEDTVTEKQKTEQAEKQKAVTEQQTANQNIADRLKEVDQQLDEVNEKVNQNPDDESLKAEHLKLENQKDSITKEKGDSDKALKAAVEALDVVNEAIKQTQQQMQTTLDKATAKTAELLKTKLEMQKENRDIAGQMAELAEKIKNQKDFKMNSERAVQMLQLAIRCLGNIVVCFSEAALFWRSIEQGCKNLQSSAFIDQLNFIVEMDEETQQFMINDAFRQMLLNYMATWVALHSIGSEYYQVSKLIGTKVRDNIRTNLFEDAAYAEAERLAAEISEAMKVEQMDIDNNQKELQKLTENLSK